MTKQPLSTLEVKTGMLSAYPFLVHLLPFHYLLWTGQDQSNANFKKYISNVA